VKEISALIPVTKDNVDSFGKKKTGQSGCRSDLSFF